MKNDTVHMLWYFHHFSYIKCVQLWIWYTLTYKYLQRVSKFIKNLPCVTYKLFQWLLKFVKYVPCGGEFGQRGGGVSIAAPLNPCFCPPLQLFSILLNKSLPPPSYILCKFGSLRGNFIFSCCRDFVSHCPPPLSKILYLPLNDLPSMYSVLSCLCTRYFIYTLMTWLKKLFSLK